MAVKITFDTPEDIALDTGTLAADTPLRERIIHSLRGVMDPELPVNIYDLGLIYNLNISGPSEAPTVHIDMTLTAPNCPVAGEMPEMTRQAVLQAVPAAAVTVKLVWEPKWDKSMLSEATRLELGLF
jgi:FeS assembly SUF system protein